MTTYLVHGFNVSDGGAGSIGRLLPYLSGDVELFSYGYVGPFSLPCGNEEAVEKLLALIKDGDSIVCHSNGALIAWAVAEKAGDKLACVVTINPALRRDTLWHPAVQVLNIANSTDWVVKYLARWWSRLYQLDGVKAAGWGAAGYYGFTTGQTNVHNWDSAMGYWPVPVKGHSGVFKGDEAPAFWGSNIESWKRIVKAGRKAALSR